MNKSLKKDLKGKNVLITAGSTWVAIDDVRVVTNIFGGSLGINIATQAYERGANVTLLMGPGRIGIPNDKKRLKIIKFKYFEELKNLMVLFLQNKKQQILIHSAAVSDYEPSFKFKGKIKSNLNKFTIHMKKTIKIVDLVKNIDPKIFLVKFKLEVNKSKKELINIASKSMLHSKADLIVANDFNDIKKDHKAFILDKNGNIYQCLGKEYISKKLLDLILVNFEKIKNG